MQATTTQRKAKATKPAWPPLPDIDNKLFSLAWLFRKSAEHQATQEHWKKLIGAKRPNKVLNHALCGATFVLEDAVNEATGRVQKEGLLPFAWQGSKIVDQIEARA